MHVPSATSCFMCLDLVGVSMLLGILVNSERDGLLGRILRKVKSL